MHNKKDIPIIDVDEFFTKDENKKREIAALVRDTCLATGFMYVKSSLLSSVAIENCLDMMVLVSSFECGCLSNIT